MNKFSDIARVTREKGVLCLKESEFGIQNCDRWPAKLTRKGLFIHHFISLTRKPSLFNGGCRRRLDGTIGA